MIPNFETYDLCIHGVRLPEVSLQPEDYKLANVDSVGSREEFLKRLAEEGLKRRGLSSKEYVDRLNYELSVYEKTGFTDYIILIWDILNFCKKNDIPTGRGRGSCPASLVLYSIGVTGIDPLKYGLYFERFVSEVRAKSQVVDGIRYIDGLMAPDVDIDIAHERRHEVVEYLFNKYPNRVCKLSTTATLKGKAVIKECAKIVGFYSNEAAEEISKAVPDLFGKVFSVEESNKSSERVKKFFDENPKVFKIAKQLEGVIKNKSSHASGYLISHGEDLLGNVIPLEKTKEGEKVSSFDMNYAQVLCIKVDLLGLQDLSLLAKVCKRIGLNHEDIDVEDPFIYEKFSKDMPTPYGLFQIGADCNFRVLNKVKPRDLGQLASVISLARPGALAYVDQFAEFVASGNYQSVHEFFDETLKETGSIPIFQEQLMRMIVDVGFSASDAELARRAVSKKKPEEVKKWRVKIEEKVVENKLDPKIGEVLWKLLNESANYSFNLSHAVSYATLSAASTFVKYKYPQDFYIECLNATEEKGDVRSEISLISKEVGYFGIQILPPDLSKSNIDFSKEGNNIRYGLKSVKGISDKSIGHLKSFVARERSNKFQIFNGAKECGLNIGILSALIQAGTMDSQLNGGDTRSSMVYEAQLFYLLTLREKLFALENGAKYNYSVFELVKDMPNWKNENGKPVVRATRLETLRKKAHPYREIFKQNSSMPELANYVYETQLLGYSYSNTLREICQKSHNRTISSSREFNEKDEFFFDICGSIKEIKYQKSKAGKQYLKIAVEDEVGDVNCMMFEPDVFDFVKGEVYEKLKEGSRVIISGKKWNDCLIIEKVRLLDEKIFMKLGDLKG